MTNQIALLRSAGAALAIGACLVVASVAPASAATSGLTTLTTSGADQPSTWWYDAMGYNEIHRGGSGKGITVAVLDGPIDPSVPELKGRVASSTSYCPGVAATAKNRGADHATNIGALIVGTGRGTGGQPGLQGIAPGATLRTYVIGGGKADGSFDLLCDGEDDDVVNAAALNAAVRDGARIVNMSFEGSVGPKFLDAMAGAERRGVILVAGTDDHDKSVGLVAGSNGVIGVNYVDRRAKLDSGAVSGPAAHFGVTTAAPGVAMRMGGHEGSRWVSQGFGWTGSSFATPLVAGGLAAVWSRFPHATANQVLQLMVHTPGVTQGIRSTGERGWVFGFRRAPRAPEAKQSGGGFGWGIFDPADMMQGDPSQYPDENPSLIMSNVLQPSWSDVTGRPLPSATASGSPRPSGSATAARSGGAAGNVSSPLPWVLLAVGGALVLVGVAVALVLSGRRRARPMTAGVPRAVGTHDATAGEGASEPEHFNA